MTEQRPSNDQLTEVDMVPTKEKFNDVPHLLDWTGIGGAPFEVARVFPSTRTLIGLGECELNTEGARALRDWLNKVIP